MNRLWDLIARAVVDAVWGLDRICDWANDTHITH